jgi:hypothetical protein
MNGSAKGLLGAFRKGFTAFGRDINEIVNFAVLFITYVVGVGITALFARLLRKQFLSIKKPNKATSYWSNLNRKKHPIDDYYRQF